MFENRTFLYKITLLYLYYLSIRSLRYIDAARIYAMLMGQRSLINSLNILYKIYYIVPTTKYT